MITLLELLHSMCSTSFKDLLLLSLQFRVDCARRLPPQARFGDVSYTVTSHQLHTPAKLIMQDVQHTIDARLAIVLKHTSVISSYTERRQRYGLTYCESPQDWSTNPTAISAQCYRLENVSAFPEAAVDTVENFGISQSHFSMKILLEQLRSPNTKSNDIKKDLLNRNPSSCGFDAFHECVECSRNTIQLSTTVVGNENTVTSILDSQQCVLCS